MKRQCRLPLVLLAVVGCSLASVIEGAPLERFERTLKGCTGAYHDDCGGYGYGYGDSDTYGVVISEDAPGFWESQYNLDAQEVHGGDGGSAKNSQSVTDSVSSSGSLTVIGAVAAATVAIFAVVAAWRSFTHRRSQSVVASLPSASSA